MNVFQHLGTSSFVISLLVSSAAYPANCRGLFEDLEKHATNGGNVEVTLSIHQSNHTVSYLGPLLLEYQTAGPREPAIPLRAAVPVPAFVGTESQYFNDRRDANGAPFNPATTDRLGVQIKKLNPIKVNLVLESWGGGIISFVPSCDGNLMHALQNNAIFTLSLEKLPVIQ